MDWTKIPAGQLHAAEQRLRVAFGEDASVVVERINTEPVFVERLANFALTGGIEPTVGQQRAREIMGKNFFGIEEAIQHFKVNPTRQQLLALSEIPFPEALLEELKDTHILVAVFPISILEIRDKAQSKGLSYDQDWYYKELFAKELSEVSWQLVRNAPVDDSFSKNWEEQLALIDKDDKVPTAQIMVYTIIGHFLSTDERLFENIHVRTSSVDSDGYRVNVGYFDSSGLFIVNYWDDLRSAYLGVSSARKS